MNEYVNINKETLQNDLLKYAVENGIINVGYVKDAIEMKKRQDYLSQHKYKIGQGKDGFWRTYIPDDIKGRRMIKKTTRIAVEDAVVKYYCDIDEAKDRRTFGDVYKHWRKIHDERVGGNTIIRYDSDFKRFFMDTRFLDMAITSITEEDVSSFIFHTVKDLSLNRESCKSLISQVKNTFQSAKKNKWIDEDPTVYIFTKDFAPYCTKKEKTSGRTPLSDEEMNKLYDRMREDYDNKPEYIPNYAVHLATLTGMRVGEISALRWDSIDDEKIVIDKSEKFDRKIGERYISMTKTGQSREFPMTEEIADLLSKVKKIEAKNGLISEWVFTEMRDGKPERIHATKISQACRSKSEQAGIDAKSVHSIRKTVNSKLKGNGVSTTVASFLLGHSEDVNKRYYTFDVTSIKEKESIVSESLKYGERHKDADTASNVITFAK